MARIEKTIFISYRRMDVYTALAVYENLKNHGYDVFFDYRSISSGDFEQIITSNIKARAHFLLILTPTALDRCNEPGDWLRREIELAIDEKRNIVPLFFKSFRFGAPSVTEKLTGKLKNLSRYNGLNVHEDYFDEAMHRLRFQYLNIPLDTVLHPVSTEVQEVVLAEQIAADKALEQIEDMQELVKQADEKPVQLTKPDPMPALEKSVSVAPPPEKQTSTPVLDVAQKRDEVQAKRDKVPKENSLDFEPALKKAKPRLAFPFSLPAKKLSIPILNYRLLGGVAAGALLVTLSAWGISNLLKNQALATLEPTQTSQPVITKTTEPTVTGTKPATATIAPSTPTPALGIGSTMTGKDGMTLLYVPAGEFMMGSEDGESDEKPVHSVYIDAFWIDKTEVTNGMYALCVSAGGCLISPYFDYSSTRDEYYGNPIYDNYPVVYVAWDMAKTYCEWAGRRLPTEAEWEKAARGTDHRTYPWGTDPPNVDLLNYNLSIRSGDTTEVGYYPDQASPYGALDMAGNVWEWVADWYDADYYATSPSRNPQKLGSDQWHVFRGGAYFSDEFDIRSANRDTLDGFGPYTGFRCAISTTP
jgi:formylglycine-generating enzyme required for sulfatase activity